MLGTLGLDWRYSLAQECWFYFRTCRNWRAILDARLHSLPLTRFEMRNGVVIEFKGVPPWNIFQEIWRYRVYDRNYPKTAPTPLTIVDIGANIGFFALYAAKCWPGADVMAYEPAPDNQGWLKNNIERSGATRVKVCPYAVADTTGRKTLHLKQESGWHSFWDDGSQRTADVETLTLDAICESAAGRIDLLKMDCEGGEYQALRDKEALLASSVRYIAMEYHERKGEGVDELLEILTRAGFRCDIRPQPQWNTGMLYGHNPNIPQSC
jgi:FkbM family methyltransferase